jgi:hypothetical protein
MNMGNMDRIVRAVLGIIVGIIAFVAVSGVAQIILWVIGAILILTAAIGFCPLYAPFHFSTKKQVK